MPQQFQSDRPTIDEIRARRTPRTRTEWVPLDADLLTRIDELEREVALAKRVDERENRRPEAPRLEAELAKLRAEAELAAVPFTFQELPRKAYRDLIRAHPSTDPQRRWDEDTFAPALIAASCVQPAMTADDAQDVWDNWGASVAYVLFGAAYAVNEEPSRVPFSVTASASTAASAPSSSTAPPEASPTASS